MASSKTRTRPKTPVRRPPPRRTGPPVPVMPLVVGGVFLVILVALVIWYRASSSSSGPNGQPVVGINCEANEQLATHYHAHLDIIWKGQPVKVPANTGIQPTCLYWMHTHDDSGVIHIEAPQKEANRQFTLGDFFKVWGQPLSSSQVSTIKVGSGDQLKVWVDGQPYTGDPAKIVLKSHEQVVIEIGPPFTEPPPTFTWDPSVYAQ